ncbi:MAG: hypothetical protein ACJAVK_003422, partial [Akkermansiaceae bacterium]
MQTTALYLGSYQLIPYQRLGAYFTFKNCLHGL